LIVVDGLMVTVPDTDTMSYAEVEPVFNVMVLVPALVSRLPVIDSVPAAVAVPGDKVPRLTRVPVPR
jgi:hypothetical protein